MDSWDQILTPTHAHIEYCPSNSGPPDVWDLIYMKQQAEETVWQFCTRFLFVKNRIPNCCDSDILATFRHNCQEKGVLNTLAQHRAQTFAELSDLVLRFFHHGGRMTGSESASRFGPHCSIKARREGAREATFWSLHIS